jgi:RNA polymerase sigma-70 factor (ECF subfamily)
VIDKHVNEMWDGEATRSSLLVRLKANEDSAWHQFADLYGPLVRRWCRYARLRETDIDDIVQEVLKTVHGAIGQLRYERPKDSFRGWLRTITKRKVQDFFRQQGHVEQGIGGEAQLFLEQFPADALESENEFDTEERRILVSKALEQVFVGCKAQTQVIFTKVVLEEQDPEEVAKELNVGIHVVYLAKSRILKKLREEFAGLIDLDRELLFGQPTGKEEDA